MDAVRVRFEGGGDEEWVKLSTGDIRVPRRVPSAVEYSQSGLANDLSSAAYWLAAGPKNSDFSSTQAELLEELLEYRCIETELLLTFCTIQCLKA